MANTDVNVRADTAIVVGAVVIAGGIILLVYNAEQKTAAGITQVYNDVTSAPGRALAAVGRGFDRAMSWLSGSDQVSDDRDAALVNLRDAAYVAPETSGPAEQESGDIADPTVGGVDVGASP